MLFQTAALLLASTIAAIPAGAEMSQPNGDRTAAAPTETNAQVSGTDATSRRTFESGQPLIRNFSPHDYGAHFQNWAIAQHPDGRMYFGNSDGVLEFDGVRWRLIPVDNNTIVRSLALDDTGRVYVGAQGEVGYLEPGADGQMRYVSLHQKIPEAWRDFADVWTTFVMDDGVYFGSSARLLRMSGDEVQSWQPDALFHFSFRIGDRLFIREWRKGLLTLVDDRLELVPGGEQFAEERVQAMLPWDAGGNILVATRHRGFFKFDGTGFRHWPTQIDEQLARDLLYRVTRLPDGRLAIGTIMGGLYLIDADGRWLGHLDRDLGLQDNAVYFTYLDQQDGLWLAHDRGIARLEVSSPVTRFNEDHNLSGAIIDLHRHQEHLFAATAQGLFRLEPGATARWIRIDGIQSQTWKLITIGDRLLVANIAGVYEVHDQQAVLLRSSEFHSMTLKASKHVPGRVYIGLMNGLAALRRSGEVWLDEGQVADVSDEIRNIHESADGRLWLGTEHTGVLRVTPSEHGDLNEPVIVERFGTDHGLPDLNQNYVYQIDDQAVFATRHGLFRLDVDDHRFVADSRFAGLFPGELRRPGHLAQGPDGRIWMWTRYEFERKEQVGSAVPQPDGRYAWFARELAALDGLHCYVILAEPDGIVWFGGPGGLFRYDPAIRRDYDQPASVLIRDVRDHTGWSLLAGVAGGAKPRIDASRRRLRFEYTTPSYDGLEANRYQVRLDGQDQEWSSWSEESFIDYANLWEGRYRFQVRARNRYGVVSDEATLEFQIIPPWYRSLWAFAAYAFLLAGAAWAGLRWRLRRVEAQKRVLKALVNERTRQLEEAVLTDQLTGLRNRRYLENHLDPDIRKLLREHQDRIAGRPVQPPASPHHLFFMIDLDYFKQVNDTYGHAAGDRVLEQFARLLNVVFRDSDILVRWGGEEFLAIARFVEHDTAEQLAERIRSTIEAHRFDIGAGQTLQLTCSIGIACFPFSRQEPEALSWNKVVDIADHCLYAAKHTQRNAWVAVCANDDGLQHDLLRLLPQEPQRLATAPGLKLTSSIPAEQPLVWQYCEANTAEQLTDDRRRLLRRRSSRSSKRL